MKKGIHPKYHDVVFMDIRMPEMDGLQLVQEMRTRHPAVPVILMTGYGSGEIAMKAPRKGAASYVPKRLLHETLIDTIDQVLELARTIRLRAVSTRRSWFPLETNGVRICAISSTILERSTASISNRGSSRPRAW